MKNLRARKSYSRVSKFGLVLLRDSDITYLLITQKCGNQWHKSSIHIPWISRYFNTTRFQVLVGLEIFICFWLGTRIQSNAGWAKTVIVSWKCKIIMNSWKVTRFTCAMSVKLTLSAVSCETHQSIPTPWILVMVAKSTATSLISSCW